MNKKGSPTRLNKAQAQNDRGRSDSKLGKGQTSQPDLNATSRSRSPLDDRPTSKDHVNQSNTTCFQIIPAAFNNVPKILYESIAVLVSEVDSLKRLRNNDVGDNARTNKEIR